MKLSELVKTIERTDKDFEKGTITYGTEEVSLQFKTVMTVSDWEYIFANNQDNQSIMARRVVRLVKDEDGTNFELDDVMSWPVDLILLVSAKTVKEEDTQKKTPDSK